jgi:ribosomal protein S18 acetylase RimI-like enzyme
VAVATPADRTRVVETVVAAFAADPAFRHFFPDEASYREQAGTYAGYLFDRRVGRGTVWVIEGGASVAMWDAPATLDGSPASAARPALPGATVARLDAFDAAVEAALPAAPHWYLGILATHPDHAGRRWGRAVMAAGLRRAAAAGLPAYLETANPGNVALYRRAGWAVDRALDFPSLPIWVMRRGRRTGRPLGTSEPAGGR